MFYYLNGLVTHTEQNLAVIDVNGAGYACRTSLYTLANLTQGKPAKLYTYLHVREDIFELYGFCEQEELNCFKMLLGISGVGPKAAISILSAVSPSQLALSIVTGDEKPLTAAVGVGKKMAQRIILELKDKMAKDQINLSGNGAGMSTAQIVIANDAVSEAVAALAVLGYSQGEIDAALKGVDVSSLTVEQIIKKALTGLMR